MTDEAKLAELMRRAVADKRAEPEFFRALLNATVYAHAPRYDRSPRLRLIQFVLPSGLMVLPFFSERAQAVSAAGQTARIVAMTGSELFEITRGATLMLNPNGTSCTLYPEEIAALLDLGEMAIVEQVQLTDAPPQVSQTEQAPVWLLNSLIALYTRLACVEAAYLAEICTPDGSGFLIALAVGSVDAERAARATITALQTQCDNHAERSVDLTTFDPHNPPAWLAELSIEPFYSRRPGKHWQVAAETIN